MDVPPGGVAGASGECLPGWWGGVEWSGVEWSGVERVSQRLSLEEFSNWMTRELINC